MNEYPNGTVVEFHYNYKKERYDLVGQVIGYVPRGEIATMPPEIPPRQIHFSEKNSKTDRVIIEVKRYSEKRREFTGTSDFYAVNPNRVHPTSPNTPRFYEDNLDIKPSEVKEEGDE